MRLLAGKVVELGLAPALSHETVRQRLKKTSLKPWQKQEWCIPKVSADFVAHMEDVLDCTPNPMTPNGRWSALTKLHPVVVRDAAPSAAPAGASAAAGL